MPEKEIWLVSGASGLLGHSLIRHLQKAGRQVIGVCNAHDLSIPGSQIVRCDLLEDGTPAQLVETYRPDVVVHAAALTNVDRCEADEAAAFALHARVAGAFAEAAKQWGARFVLLSTDQLWAGDQVLVDETTPPAPINVYAKTKLAGEQAALSLGQDALVIRTNFFGPGPAWRQSFSDWIEHQLRSGEGVDGFQDVFFTPIALDLLCPLLIALADAHQSGVWHLAGGERISKYDFATALARHLGLSDALVRPARVADANLRARRPTEMSLETKKAAAWFGQPMPTVHESLATLPRTVHP